MENKLFQLTQTIKMKRKIKWDTNPNSKYTNLSPSL